MSVEYPSVDFKTLYPILLFLLQCKKTPEIIEDSPYNENIKYGIKDLLSNIGFAEGGATDKKLTDLDIEAESIRLYESMKRIELHGKMDEKEKMSLLKLQMNSLQDLLNMAKEAKEIKKIREFEDIVFTILTDEQKEKVLKLFN